MTKSLLKFVKILFLADFANLADLIYEISH
jgi:hypothetical protein